MESELLKTFDVEGNEIGTATRSEVHKEGYWHETFHCWFTEMISGEHYLYFQIRSAGKKDYPNLLDITAAGHILADEDSVDGFREVKEELGVNLELSEIISLGLIKDSLVSKEFIDNELCHVYLYDKHVPFDNYSLQTEEVSGIVKASLDDFEKLWFGTLDELDVEGFRLNTEEKMLPLSMKARKSNFVPHEDRYIERVVKAIRER